MLRRSSEKRYIFQAEDSFSLLQCGEMTKLIQIDNFGSSLDSGVIVMELVGATTAVAVLVLAVTAIVINITKIIDWWRRKD